MKKLSLFLCVLFISISFSSFASNSQFNPPTNLTASNIYFDNATLSWSSDTNAYLWILSYNISQSNTPIEQVLSTNSTQVFNLVSSITYNWKVRMIDINGDTTQWSEVATFQTPDEITGCDNISGLSIDAMGTNGITVQWQANPNQNQWEIVYGELGSNPDLDGTRAIVSNYFYVIPSSNLILNNWYQIAVRNKCLGANSGWSYINTRYISNQFYDLPVQQTFESDEQNAIFGFVNGSLNPWVLGNAYNTTLDGSNSIYISTTGGTNNNYYPLVSAISYAYIDVLIPDYASSFYLDFKWKCLGETSNDLMKVYLLNSNSALDIYQLPQDVNRIGQTAYNNQNSDWQSEHIEIPAAYIGQVRRLVFAWQNNSSIGGLGGAIVDDIYITGRYCATPTNPTHSYVSSNYANLSWNFAQGQEFFNIQYRKIGTTAWSEVDGVTSNHILDNLDDNSTYIYRVQADCGLEQSFFSVTDTFTTLIRCLAPEDVHAISYWTDSAILTWSDDPNVTQWILEYGVDNGESTNYTRKIVFSRQDTLRNLTPDTYYNVRVKAISLQNDTSIYSNTYRFHTLCPYITQYPSNELPNSITWTNPNGYSNTYSCWEVKGDTLLSPVYDLSQIGYPELSFKFQFLDSVASFTITKLLVTNNGNIFYNLKTLYQSNTLANNTIELPQYVNEHFVRFAFVPSYYQVSVANIEIKDFNVVERCKSPAEITVLELTSNSVSIDWTEYSNNTSWDIIITDTILNTSSNFSTTIHPYQINNLIPNRPYKIWIRSNCGSEMDNNWTKTVIHTLEDLSCPTPTNFYAYHIASTKGDEAIFCGWDALENTMWEFQYKQKYAVDWTSLILFTNPQYVLRNLDMETEYMFRVRAICSLADTSYWSNTVNVRISDLEDIIDYSKLVKIYPNPAKDILNIETETNDFSQTKLIDQNGRIVMTWDKLPNNINVSSFPQGNYYLQINTPQGKVNKKIIIVR